MLKLDHLVYASPDLQTGIDTLESLLGIRATPGGPHPGWGTRNALIALGDASFIEVIGPDPDQPTPAEPRIFQIDSLSAPALVTWAMKSSALDRLVSDARRRGIHLGDVKAATRVRPDGVVLAWRLTDPRTVVGGGIVPFAIDWGTAAHPATTAARGAALVEFTAEHPDPSSVRQMLDPLGVDLPVTRGARPLLIATIDCPRGRVMLR